ncbi:DUF2637 domain-containing protein [Streptomyces longwoodensis]|uniref:DUF2637 domain-containing protein n=1 Tax=Streptomyces longwoodensis TaxID=68231 RepID=UPI00340F002B
MAAPIQLTRMHRVLIGVVVTGAVVIAGIGFAGSYAAVRELAIKKGFGNFSYVFPVGIDAGICVLLALDLLLTWIRIPFPLLRQTAWLLTAATIAFNGAALCRSFILSVVRSAAPPPRPATSSTAGTLPIGTRAHTLTCLA